MTPNPLPIKETTAILLFTRNPQQEIAAKTFIPGQKDKDLQIASRLVSYVQKQVKQSGLPLFTAYGHQQKGNTFGERLANEVEKVFGSGHQRVIIIGNDCPQLDARILVEANDRCEQGDVVLGPSTDGGLYLIGLHKSQFQKEKFIQLAWETENLQCSFNAYLQGQSATAFLLPTFDDVDGPDQLIRVAGELSLHHILKQFLLSILEQIIIPNFYYFLSLPQRFFLRLANLRAPPGN